MNQTNKVFVYGTLKGGHDVRGLNRFPGATFVGEADTTEAQYTMVSLGTFPGVIPGGFQDVRGEVWEVTAEVMEQLDHIEGYPTFYNRKIVSTTQGDAWMYYLSNEWLTRLGDTEYCDDIIMDGEILEWVA